MYLWQSAILHLGCAHVQKARRVGGDNARLPVDMAQVANSWEGLQTHH